MKIAEGQKTQFIVLCCLILLVVGYAVLKAVGVGSQAQTRQTPAVTKPHAKSAESPEASSGQADVQTPAKSVVVASGATGDANARDPFVPQVGDNPASARPIKTLPPPIFPPGKLSGLGPLMPPMGFDRDITVNTHNTPAREPEPDPSQMLTLTGVIQGSVNVAILRGANNARYIVREGQVIDGKYRVDLVTRYGVRLSFNGKSYLLSLGGSDARKGA